MQIENGIAVSNDVVSKEQLPFPYVYYPGMYSAYFAFSENKNTPLYLCSCSMESIENHIKLNLKYKKNTFSDPSLFSVLNGKDFPLKLFNYIKAEKLPNSEQIISHLKFENKLCHECNRKVPEYNYCQKMYGGSFKQKYGWYIIKQYYEYGILPLTYEFIPEITPKEILELIKINPTSIKNLSIKVGKPEYMSELKKFINENNIENINQTYYSYKIMFDKQNRKINNIIENTVREKFDYKKVGEAWTSETILYYIIKNLFPQYEIFRHWRPELLKGLEIDIFIKELNIAIEYQGIQHFRAVKHWGGERAFEKLIQRDSLKKKICKSLGIRLIYFNYNEELSNKFVLSKVDL